MNSNDLQGSSGATKGNHTKLQATPGKRRVYVVSFTVLGILASFLAHAIMETGYIHLLRSDFATYGFGWTWGTWHWIHHGGSVVLFVLGIVGGYASGTYWWRVLYIEGRYRKITKYFGP